MSIRAAVKRRITAMVRESPAFAGVEVAYSFPRGQLEGLARVIVGTDVQGSETPVGMQANRTPHADEWDLEVTFVVRSDDEDGEEAEQQVEELYGEFRELIVTDPKLGGAVAGLQWARIGDSVRGPVSVPAEGAQGFEALLVTNVTCRARI